MRLIVISGRSGSGKSTALNALEDEGFNCIDNFPVRLLGSLVADADPSERLAICIDARNRRADLERLPSVLDDVGVAEPGVDCRIVYLDARSPTLVKRFSETRRRHPLTDATTDLREAIDLEREWLAELAGLADLSIDTTALSAPELAAEVRERLATDGAVELVLLFRSFAYRSGVPVDADFVFDVRCLPNPHWREDLRDLSGLDTAVREYLDSEAEVAALCGGHPRLPGRLDSEVRGRPSPLPVRRHWLHGRTPPLGVRGRTACGAFPRPVGQGDAAPPGRSDTRLRRG